MDDLVKSARSALTRAELPGMSLIEHLEELRKRVIPCGSSEGDERPWFLTTLSLDSRFNRSDEWVFRLRPSNIAAA